MSDEPPSDLARRVVRIQDTLDIQQLAVRYAMAIDSRDLDAWVDLFVPDVIVGRRGVGRDALREFITPQLQRFYRSIHQIVGHRVDLVDAEQATGAVYCRAEHEVSDRWIVIAIRYDDEYRKIDGEWYFVRRIDRHFYEADVTEHPQQVGFRGWASSPPRPIAPEPSATWVGFWRGVDTAGLTCAPVLEG